MVASLDDLFRLWENLRGTAEMPLHSAFGPEVLRPWLPNLLIVEVHRAEKRFYYRLAGTALSARYNMNFTGRWLEDMRIEGSPGYWEANFAATAAMREPRLGAVPQFDADFNQRRCTWLMLPLVPDLPPRGGPGPLDLVILGCVLFGGQ
ncbi:PAS domain-containing protein [Dongia rigui]|uniref:PAS domain-containing protein n=1 Tax=Dongia rigui TaxID=940149 RepID=A0ABU5DZ46_9PROT|nr:PAS domain-containing protein [Dongia rigui]MDY0872195.1 PAS domain-containing protein [Dongia rigui]